MSKKNRKEDESSQARDNKHNPHATRETVESIVVAVILAFLFRAFIAEAFVIPTGSMAPTLFGRNKDVTCNQCGHMYAVGASSENERHEMGRDLKPPKVAAVHCPVCRVRMEIDPTNGNHTSFTGDRILVSKFTYDLSEPHRWDVIVFKFPGNAKQNYIKRLIGLPNEALIIEHGNIYTAGLLFRRSAEDVFDANGQENWVEFFAKGGVTISPNFEQTDYLGFDYKRFLITDGGKTYAVLVNEINQTVSVYGDQFRIRRKPPHKVRAMAQVVDDTKYIGGKLQQSKWPSRWQDWSGRRSWNVGAEGRRFSTDGGAGVAWLRYRHLFPTEDDWEEIELTGRAPAGVGQRLGRLIDDYYAYNDYRLRGNGFAQPDGPMHWVGDLTVECDVKVESNSGALLLDLVKGGANYRCQIDVETGRASLTIIGGEAGFDSPNGAPAPERLAATSVKGPGDYRLRFANVDDQLLLWVNDSVVKFDGPTTYASRANVAPVWSRANAGDAEPVGLGSVGAAVTVNRIRLYRDLYYIADVSGGNTSSDYVQRPTSQGVGNILSDPTSWATAKLFASRGKALFCLEEDQFFPLGDNSPHSRDARTWGSPPFVDRKLLIGKAVLIYWPHPWQTPVPYFPNFQRMGLIR